MSITRISTRYAKSLMDLALERKELETVKNDMSYLDQALKSRDLVLFLKSPIIAANKKLSVFKSVFDGKLSKMTMSFCEIIIRKGRENYLPEIVVNFLSQYRDFNRISTINIITASPLSQETMAEIKKILLSSPITMDKVEVSEKVDPSIIGGFVIEVGDKLYDASVAHKLAELKKEFSNNSFVKSF
jgi:F-type H+-transporting ATPase subunit delta